MKKFKVTHMQETMLYESMRDPSRYVTVLRYDLQKPTDSQMITQRLGLLAERHEALRTTFVRDENGVYWNEVAERIDDTLFRLELQDDELMVFFHHALLDGWSVGVLMRELLSEEEPSGNASPFRYYGKWLEKQSGHLDWWNEYLGEQRVCSELPQFCKTEGYERRELRFPLENSERLKNTARELGITAGRLIEAVWCMLIARYNGGRSLVCVVNTGRSAPVPGITGMVGMCVNTLPILTELPKPPESVTFTDWVRLWCRRTAEAEKRGVCALTELIHGKLPHILSIDPCFDGEGFRLVFSSAMLVTDFDVAFTLGDTITAEFAYNAFAYSDEAVSTVRGHFLTALNAVLENPQIALEKTPVLTVAEIAELTAFNEDTGILETISCKTVVDLWRESTRLHANSEALVCGKTRLSYAELSETAGKLACALRAKGIGPEMPAAILLPRSEQYVIAELAVLLAGGFFIPLDTEWPEQRIQTILNEVKPKVVIDEKTYAELLALNGQLSVINGQLPRHAAYMIMTSGTTGAPKGVVVEHRSLANFCLWAKERYGWRESDSCALELGFSFDGSMWSIWLPLISGGTLHILPDKLRFDLRALGDYLCDKHITHIDLPLTMAEAFREIYSGENTLPDLRVMVTGGEEVRRFVPAPYKLSNEYGPTECTVCCSTGWLSENDKPITVGSPPSNMNAYILDEWNRLCPDGVTGQVVFSGVQVARGYYNAPELTAERFVNNPFADGNPNHGTLYRTGDLMKWINRGERRELVFMGRADNQIKLSGFRIELAEIENVLLSHPEVISAVAVVTENEVKRLYAYAVAKTRVNAIELDEFLAAELPYFMRPVIFLVDEIPLTSSGKVDFKRLSLLGTKKTAEATAPVSENEQILVSVVSKMLGVLDIGTNHNYIELGGNSINAMRIVFHLEKAGFLLSAKELITSASLADAAAKMRSPAGTGTAAHGEKRISQTVFTPLAAQQAMIFLAETSGSGMYTVTVTLNAPGLDIKTLKDRIDRAAELHDILRAAFERGADGRILGRIHKAHCIRVDAENCANADGIDPLRDPLLNLMLDGDTLTIRYHHIALDGHSVSLLIQELLHGKFHDAAPSFALFANRLAAQAERITDDETWWREQCRDVRAARLLPPKTNKTPKYRRVAVCSPELLTKCAEAAKPSRVTPAAFMLTAWSVVVNTLGAEDGDILIPFVASCRDDDALMGMCAETRPLVFSYEGNTFGELARSVQNAMLESVSHWFIPQTIIGKLPDYLFVFEDGAAELTAGGEQNYDLVIKFSGRGELIYNTARLPEHDAEIIAARLEAAINAALEDRISVLLEGEHELVTKTFAHGRLSHIKYHTAAEAFTAAVKLYARRIALETANGALTYSELYGRAIKYADDLKVQNIGAGDVVPCCASRDEDGIISQLGIVLSGAAFCPIDPAWPEARRGDIIHELDGKIQSDSAYVIYTSGTTGKPKGVVLTQEALSNQIAWALDEFGFAPGDKVLHYVAFTFDPSVWTIFTALCSGATLCLLPEYKRLDPDAAARHITENDITICVLPATVSSEILHRIQSSRLRLAFLGGESPKNLPQRTDGLVIVNCYGPTEACINAAFYTLKPYETETRIIGRPVAGTNCYVLDARSELCPIGVQGELCIAGIQLASGYLNRPDENAAAFIIHPHFGRLYKTGDRAVWNEDGTLTFCGRTDSQVKIRGNRVELSEIEHVLRESLGVTDAKVIYKDGALDAYVVTAKEIDAAALKKRLPSYMLPRSVTVMEAFPLTQNGKVDSKALPAPLIAAAEDAKPLTEPERAVASAWKTALGLPHDFVIRRGDSFNDLGGHSLLLFHVVGLLSSSGVTADIKTLIEHPALGDLAEAIRRRETTNIHAKRKKTRSVSDTYKNYIQKMEEINLTNRRDFRHVLITGGTGFLGSHLIRELYEQTEAVIHLPVRGGTARLRDVLEYYFGAAGAEMARSSRICAYPADICEKPPDIDAPLDAIFHTAADIRHYAPEAEMYRANVTATDNMLTLSERNPQTLFAHISTTSAVNAPVIYETDTDLGPEFENIYQRTKQLAEQRVLDAGKNGLTYAVFRVGHVSPGFTGGSVARNWEINAMLRLTGAMLLTELLPEQDYKIGYGYVDETARALRLLSMPTNLNGHVFHIDNPNTLRLSEIFKLAGLKGVVLPKRELITRLTELAESQDTAVRQAAAEYLGRLTQGSLEKDSADVVAGTLHMDATLLLLKRLGFEWPHVTKDYINGIIHNLRNKGGMPK